MSLAPPQHPQPCTLAEAEWWCGGGHRGRTMPLAIRKGGLAIDAVQYGLTRPGAQPGEHRLPPNA